MAKPTREFRATRIVATIGPTAEKDGLLGRLLTAGVDVVRLNGAHCQPGDIARRVALVREAEKQVGRPVGVHVACSSHGEAKLIVHPRAWNAEQERAPFC